MTNSLYEQLKDDLGYLGLTRLGRVLRPSSPKKPSSTSGAISSS